MAVTGLGPQPIRINIEPLTSPARWNLTWDDNAYVYGVECSTNLLDPEGWTVITKFVNTAVIEVRLATVGRVMCRCYKRPVIPNLPCRRS